MPDSLAEKAAKQIAGYYAHIAALDECLGKLLGAINEAGIEDNKIFVFTSDHGDMLLSHGQSNKQKQWDESIRVPFLLRFPQKIRKSREVSIPFGTIDIMPTLLGLSGLPIPDSVEGTDFSTYLLGNENINIEAGLIMCPVPFHQWSFANGGREYRGVRSERYTYARDLRGPWLLFDNKQDPYQLNNLINNPGYSEIQKELDEELNLLLKRPVMNSGKLTIICRNGIMIMINICFVVLVSEYSFVYLCAKSQRAPRSSNSAFQTRTTV